MATLDYNNAYGPSQNQNPLDGLLDSVAVDHRQRKFKALLDDLQSGILKHHARPHSQYWFLHFREKEDFKEFLKERLKYITSCGDNLNGKLRDKCHQNIFLTHAGYKKLEIPDHLIPGKEFFVEQMYETTKLNKAFYDRDIIKTLKNKSGHELHAIVHISCGDRKDKKSAEEKFRVAVEGFEEGLRELSKSFKEKFAVLHKEKGQSENPFPEHLQIKEGIGNPRFFPNAFSAGNGKEKEAMQLAISALKAWKMPPLKIALTFDKGGGNDFSCGSFGVLAKFEINEDAVKKVIAGLSKKLKNSNNNKNSSKALAIGTIFGRFKDGTPLTLSNKEIDFPTNNFNYLEQIKNADPEDMDPSDKYGSRCPFFAHIRKAYPRHPGSEDKRIVRRSIFYQEKAEKGLLFVSYQDDLKKFDYILNELMLKDSVKLNSNSKRAFEIETGKDILFSSEKDVYKLHKEWNKDPFSQAPTKFPVPATMVRFKYGFYYFAPSISFFENLVGEKRGSSEPEKNSKNSESSKDQKKPIGTIDKEIRKSQNKDGIEVLGIDADCRIHNLFFKIKDLSENKDGRISSPENQNPDGLKFCFGVKKEKGGKK